VDALVVIQIERQKQELARDVAINARRK